MKKLDRFILKEIISDGSAGTVYKAEEQLPGDNHRPVALKVLPAISDGDEAAQSRYFGEVKVLAQLAVHPHIVTIYSMGLTDHYPWLAMEQAEQTLAGKLSSDPADPAFILNVLTQVARGLAAMHSLTPPLIHQDIKPANILIDSLGNFKITDFSLATVVAANRTHGLATVRYAAPELLSSEFGKVNTTTDLYALGHIAYELALGERLHRAQFPAIFEGNSSKEPPPNKWMMWHASQSTMPDDITEPIKSFPSRFSAIIKRLMAKPMNQRYDSADELLRDLDAVRAEVLTPVALSSTLSPRPFSPSPKVAPAAAPETTYETVEVADAHAAHAAQPAPTAAPAPAPAASSLQYWVRLRGRVSGPYDLSTLQRQVRQGQLSRLHQLSSDQRTWKQASEIEGLYGPTVV